MNIESTMLLINFKNIYIYFHHRSVILLRIFRVINLIRTIRIFHYRRHFITGSRHLVGQNKKRTIGNGFDLDLCCITGKLLYISRRKKTEILII